MGALPRINIGIVLRFLMPVAKLSFTVISAPDMTSSLLEDLAQTKEAHSAGYRQSCGTVGKTETGEKIYFTERFQQFKLWKTGLEGGTRGGNGSLNWKLPRIWLQEGGSQRS